MSVIDFFRNPDGLVDLEPEAVKEELGAQSEVIIIDVRTRPEYSRNHIDGAKHIPLGRLMGEVEGMEREANYLLICKTGHRSRAAAAGMLRLGFSNVSHLRGGMNAWNRVFGK